MVPVLLRCRPTSHLRSTFSLTSLGQVLFHAEATCGGRASHASELTLTDLLPPQQYSWNTTHNFAPNVIHFMRRHDVRYGQDSSFKNVRLPGAKGWGLSLSVSNRHTINHDHLKYLVFSGHPLVDMSLSRYEAKCRDEPLWIWVNSVGGGHGNCKLVVRRTAQKKTRRALVLALCEYGFDRIGKMVRPQDEALPARDRTVKVQPMSDARLFGTLRLLINDPIKVVNVPMADLKKCFLAILRDGSLKVLETKTSQPQSFRGNSPGRRGTTGSRHDYKR